MILRLLVMETNISPVSICSVNTRKVHNSHRFGEWHHASRVLAMSTHHFWKLLFAQDLDPHAFVAVTHLQVYSSHSIRTHLMVVPTSARSSLEGESVEMPTVIPVQFEWAYFRTRTTFSFVHCRTAQSIRRNTQESARKKNTFELRGDDCWGLEVMWTSFLFIAPPSPPSPPLPSLPLSLSLSLSLSIFIKLGPEMQKCSISLLNKTRLFST